MRGAVPPGADPALVELLDDALRCLDGLRSPFSGNLEAPPVICRLAVQHGGRVEDGPATTRDALRELARDLLVFLFQVPPGVRGLAGLPAPPGPLDDW